MWPWLIGGAAVLYWMATRNPDFDPAINTLAGQQAQIQRLVNTALGSTVSVRFTGGTVMGPVKIVDGSNNVIREWPSEVDALNELQRAGNL